MTRQMDIGHGNSLVISLCCARYGTQEPDFVKIGHNFPKFTMSAEGPATRHREYRCIGIEVENIERSSEFSCGITVTTFVSILNGANMPHCFEVSLAFSHTLCGPPV